ncbi:MAG: hypothetical protein R3307_00155, partial [Anaerolineales bacterium]|nr:hypothetical protein [Anaerolineales bacterium]
ILFTAFFQEKTLKARSTAFLKTSIGFGVLFSFYLLFNLALSGSPLPNTFYAKQAEYAAYLQSLSLSERLSDYLLPLIASPFIVLIPGLFLWAFRIFRERNWGALAGLIWALGYIGIYFMRLPAYQHGRYIIPAFPVLYLWGILGMLEYANSSKANQRIVFLWQSLLALLILTFQFVGARQNAQDVVFVETQMVQTAQWVNENLPPDAILGVHDVGAIGYFTQNPIVDLAGLVTPDVVPFIRDEVRLGAFLDSKNAEYLIAFPGWYPQLTGANDPIFEARHGLYKYDGLMTIYRWTGNK